MKKKSLYFSLLAIFILFFSINSHSQAVIVNVYQPPPNQWNVADLWNLTLTNTSSESIKVYLYGTVESITDGLIFEGTSAVFGLTPNFSGRIDPYRLEPVDADYSNAEYEEIVMKTGTMPEGTYTICVYVKDAQSDEELGRDCIIQPITPTSPPELINPQDEGTVTEELPIFLWTPPMPLRMGEFVTYQLRIVELLDGQEGYEAMEANPAWFVQKGITSTSFQLPISARPLEPGKSYAWQVTAINETQNYEIGKSEVWSFDFPDVSCSTKIDDVIVECNGQDNYGNQKYKVTVKYLNLSSSLTCIPYLCLPSPGSNSTAPLPGCTYLNIVSGSCVISNIIPAGGTIVPYGSSGGLTDITFDMTNPSLPITIDVEGGSRCPDIQNQSFVGSWCWAPFTIDELPECPCDSCADMVVAVDNFNITPFGTSGNQYNIEADITINMPTGNIPIYGLECQVQSYTFTATPPTCSNGVTSIEQSGMFLIPATSLNGTTAVLFNETISGSAASNNNAAKAVKITSTSPITGAIPVKLTLGLPGPIAGLNPDCCKIKYDVCVKATVFYDLELCKSCTFIHCFDFTNQ